MNRRSWQIGFLGGALACIVLLLGCFGTNEAPRPEEGSGTDTAASGPLLITVVGSQETADVLKREWSARSDSEVEVRLVAPDEAADEARLNSDLVVFPTGMLGELAQGDALLPLDEERSQRDAFGQADLLLLGREYEGNWGGRTLALPLGSALPVMVYRADTFETLNLDPPTTWEAYAAAAAKLQEALDAGTLPEGVATAVLEPTDPVDAARHFLVRAAAYARVPGRYSGLFEYDSMTPELTSPAFAKALEEYHEAVAGREATEEPIGYAETSRRLLAGEAALGVTFLIEAPDLESEESLERAAQVSVAPVPGSTEFWQPRSGSWGARDATASVPTWGDFGMLIGIGRSVADRDRALRALDSIVDAEIGTPLSASAAGTAPYRKSQLASISRWTKQPATLPANAQYAAAIEQAQSAPDHLLLPRIPGRERYLEALGEEVRLALTGEKTTDAALADAAAAWEKITEELGRESQIEAYRASLGLTH